MRVMLSRDESLESCEINLIFMRFAAGRQISRGRRLKTVLALGVALQNCLIEAAPHEPASEITKRNPEKRKNKKKLHQPKPLASCHA